MVSIENKSKKKKIIFEAGYILIFIIISVFVGIHHEHWADEAQSWLIARDNSVIGIFKAIRYEGTPALWHILLKICITCGLKYENLYILTTALSVIGIIFLHKNKNVPKLFKILLPFTYFIFYQYTVVARSYSLLFPLLMCIAYLYPDKEKHLLKYGVLLCLIMNVSLHGFLIAGGFWFEFLVEKFWKYKKEKIKFSKNLKVFFIILTILFLGVVIYVLPSKDCSYGIGSKYKWFSIISGAMFTSTENIVTNSIGVVLFIVSLMILINKKNFIRTLALLVPNIWWIAFIHGNVWHIGILFLLIVTVAIINDDLRNDKLLYIIFLISIIIQLYWNVFSCFYDIRNEYASGEAVSEYLRTLNIEDSEIYAYDFWAIQVNPYFENNIYKNYSKAYYFWSFDEGKSNLSRYMLSEEFNEDIYIIPVYYYYEYKDGKKLKVTNDTFSQTVIMKKLDDSGIYKKKEFNSNMLFKNLEYESTSIYVYSKKQGME